MRNTRVIASRYGGPEVLRVAEEDCPEPKPGEVRVRVLAAGVALPDVMAREGIHPETPRVPFTPGWDLVGVVDRVGAGVSKIATGQTVAAMPISGAYANFVCLPEDELIPVPSGVDPADAVSLDLTTTGADDAYVFGLRTSGDSSPLFGLTIIEAAAMSGESPILIDTTAIGVLYTGSLALAADPYTGFTKNLTTLRVELKAKMHVRNPKAAVSIGAS